MEYLLWDISYLNVLMLITDTISVYPIRDDKYSNRGSSTTGNNKENVSWSGFIEKMKQIKG